MDKTSQRPVRVGLISLGCDKNLVDAEIMLGALIKGGFEITNDAARAEVVIVNTCSFIDSAQEESVDTILESAALREAKNRGQSLIVSGCLPQRFREELPGLLPEVDAFMGIDQVAQAPQIVHQALARRAARVAGSPPSEILASSARMAADRPIPKSQIVGRLSELGKSQPPSEHDRQNDSQGRSPFAGPKIAAGAAPVALQPAALDPPIVNVNPRPRYIPDYATPRFRLTPKHFAYLKIAEGCNHPCSFCIIPRLRGSHRSRAQTDVVEEARRLIAQGVKELNLISQDSTYYGLDLRPARQGSIAAPEKFAAAAKALPADAPTLCSLVRALNRLRGEFWIRLLYTHPAHWTDELIQTIADCPKVARYIDIPLQHIHPVMLERMRRETSQQHLIDLIAKIRAGIPGLAVRTTFIVGFPGETEPYFQALLDFIRETKFERLGVFTYSQEAGTRSATMSRPVPDRIRKRRRDLAMQEQLKVARQIFGSFVGRRIKVLVEKEASARELQDAKVSSWEHGLIRSEDEHRDRLRGRYLLARGEADAPDIDGRVYIRGRQPPGEFAWVKIIGHTDYDLIAEPG